MHTPAAILDHINHQHRTAFTLLDRYPTGEQGAFALADPLGTRFVLKWTPDPTAFRAFQRAQHVTNRLRAIGYPAPQYALLGATAKSAYAIQYALPGQPLAHLSLACVPDFLALNKRQVAQAGSEPSTWPAPIRDPVLAGGNGFCLLEPMQTYSPATARWLQLIQAYVRRADDLAYPTTDIVHFDCHPRNILAVTDRITGVIDWDGWCAGDCMFDVATMLFYSYTDPQIRAPLWQTITRHVGPRVGGVYLAHLIHRQVDWSLRYHDQGTITHWLMVAQQILADLLA